MCTRLPRIIDLGFTRTNWMGKLHEYMYLKPKSIKHNDNARHFSVQSKKKIKKILIMSNTNCNTGENIFCKIREQSKP